MALIFTTLGTPVTPVQAQLQAEPAFKPLAPDASVAIAFFDDQSSPDLGPKHGVTITKESELQFLIDLIVALHAHGRCAYGLVSEYAGNSEPAILSISAFSQPPTPPDTLGLTSTELSEATDRYGEEVKRWGAEGEKWRAALKADCEKFFAAAAAARAKQQRNFIDHVRISHQADFARSDLVGLFQQFANFFDATRSASPRERHICIFRSDGEDSPGAKKPFAKPYRPKCKSALSERELPADCELIFLNTSHQPERSPLFRGTPNMKFHFDSFDEFMAALTPDALKRAGPSPAASP